MEKVKCYEFDFGDTNLITENIDDVLNMIKSEMHDLPDDGVLEYTITINRLTREEIEALPEWA